MHHMMKPKQYQQFLADHSESRAMADFSKMDPRFRMYHPHSPQEGDTVNITGDDVMSTSSTPLDLYMKSERGNTMRPASVQSLSPHSHTSLVLDESRSDSDDGVTPGECDDSYVDVEMDEDEDSEYPSPTKKLYHCNQCKYVTDRKNNLKRHVITMHEKCAKTLECCDKVFANKAALRDHVVSCHKEGYDCRVCGRNFCRKALLKRHITVHSGQKDYVCSVCGYATSHKSNLDRHKRRHLPKELRYDFFKTSPESGGADIPHMNSVSSAPVSTSGFMPGSGMSSPWYRPRPPMPTSHNLLPPHLNFHPGRMLNKPMPLPHPFPIHPGSGFFFPGQNLAPGFPLAPGASPFWPPALSPRAVLPDLYPACLTNPQHMTSLSAHASSISAQQASAAALQGYRRKRKRFSDKLFFKKRILHTYNGTNLKAVHNDSDKTIIDKEELTNIRDEMPTRDNSSGENELQDDITRDNSDTEEEILNDTSRELHENEHSMDSGLDLRLFGSLCSARKRLFPTLHRCRVCDEVFGDQLALSRHLESSHSDDPARGPQRPLTLMVRTRGPTFRFM